MHTKFQTNAPVWTIKMNKGYNTFSPLFYEKGLMFAPDGEYPMFFPITTSTRNIDRLSGDMYSVNTPGLSYGPTGDPVFSKDVIRLQHVVGHMGILRVNKIVRTTPIDLNTLVRQYLDNAPEGDEGIPQIRRLPVLREGGKGRTVVKAIRHGDKKARTISVGSPKWLPTNRTVKHKGVVRKLWKSAKDASVLAVKRIVKAADGSKKVRFQRV